MKTSFPLPVLLWRMATEPFYIGLACAYDFAMRAWLRHYYGISSESEVKEIVSNALGIERRKKTNEKKGEAIVLRDIPREQAKAEIEALLRNTTDSLYYFDIMKRLGLDLELVVSVCNELVNEGKIEYGNEGARAKIAAER